MITKVQYDRSTPVDHMVLEQCHTHNFTFLGEIQTINFEITTLCRVNVVLKKIQATLSTLLKESDLTK